MDMRDMVSRVKRGEPLYGNSQLTEYMQGVASRQSRYAGTWIHVMPWFNLINHNQVCHAHSLSSPDLLFPVRAAKNNVCFHSFPSHIIQK